MDNTKVSIRSNNYFPPQFHILCYILIFFGFGMLFVIWYVGVVLILLCALVLTAHYGVEIDTEDKTIDEYLKIIGFRKSDKTSFSSINYIYINSNTYSQEYGFVPRYYESGRMYSAYLKTADDRKIFLSDHKILRKLKSKLMPFAYKLDIEVRDLS